MADVDELPSSDEEDEDYDPTAELKAEKAEKKRKLKQQKLKQPRGRGQAMLAGKEDDDDDDDDDDADLDVNEDDDADVEFVEEDLGALGKVEELGPRARDRAARVAAAWDALKKRTAVRPASAPKEAEEKQEMDQDGAEEAEEGQEEPAPAPKPAGVVGGYFTDGLMEKIAPAKRRATGDAHWKRVLFAEGGVKKAPARGRAAKATGGASIAFAMDFVAPVEQVKFHNERMKVTDAQQDAERAARAEAAAAAALALKQAQALIPGARTKDGRTEMVVKETFAGREIEVTRMVDDGEREALQEKQKRIASGGLEAMVANLSKKSKVNVLDKTRLDWDSYKRKNTEIDEELEAHKKSGGRYLEKQEFLRQAELRQYEKERDARLASDIRTRGRV
ncbi:unnamed protein product [Pedinophyceae sp. YPF-701]|nr:unnamed protein product [Pedinophyceae sp. YPF-701]